MRGFMVAVGWLFLCSTAHAGQAIGHLQVGITITGKQGAAAPAATEPPPAAKFTPAAKAAYAKRVRACAVRYASYDPATHTYVAGDGSIRQCP
jgi:hypothetical protein